MSVLTLQLIIYVFSAQAKEYIFCSRQTEMTVIESSEMKEKDGCTGSAVIQGIRYECSALGKIDKLREGFISDLQSVGAKYCRNYCKKRDDKSGRNCLSRFTEVTKCGFTVPTSEAQEFGDGDGRCNPTCSGTAFAYCSIYHAPYLTTGSEFFKGKSPNCECYPEEE